MTGPQLAILHHGDCCPDDAAYVEDPIRSPSLRRTQRWQPKQTMTKKQRIPHKFQPWIAVRKKYRLTDAQVQMARELGLSPKRFSNYADRKDQPWKLPLPEFIEALYEKQFGRVAPEVVLTIEAMAAEHQARREAKKLAKQEALAQEESQTEEAAADEPASPEADDQ